MRARSLVAILVCLQWVLAATIVSFAASAPGTVEIKAGGFGGDAVSSWPVYIAQDRGFFAKEGIQTTFTRSYEQMMALIGGNFEVIGEAADAPILAADKGAILSLRMILAAGPRSLWSSRRACKISPSWMAKFLACGKFHLPTSC